MEAVKVRKNVPSAVEQKYFRGVKNIRNTVHSKAVGKQGNEMKRDNTLSNQTKCTLRNQTKSGNQEVKNMNTKSIINQKKLVVLIQALNFSKLFLQVSQKA